MNHPVKDSVLVARGNVLRIDAEPDALVYVWEGAVWLTQENDRRDYYLGTGRWLRLDRKGMALVQALQNSIVTVTRPARERRVTLGARLRRFWAGLYAPHARPTSAAY